MKKIYEFPEVTVFNVGDAPIMQAASNFQIGNTVGTDDEFTNSNSFDDQATPWYRR